MQINEKDNNIRSSVIYGNCQVFSPEGRLMFRCLEKRAKWYLERKLAIIVSENPFVIQLTFQPKGQGVIDDKQKAERYNKCVVCGNEQLNMLTKHHIIPYEYRKNFPDEKKQHNSLFVVPICKKCHVTYEQHHASILKRKLAKECGTRKNASHDILPIKKTVNTLLKSHDKSINIPAKKLEKLKEKAFKLLLAKNMIENIEQLDNPIYLKEVLDNMYKEYDKRTDNYGKIIVESWKDKLGDFELMWVEDFVGSMKPKYIPDYLIAYRESQSL
jgi:hypothetical protein